MEVADFLTRERERILADAEESLRQAHSPHYERVGASEVRRRLSALYDGVVDAVAARSLGRLLGYAESVAEERFEAGYDLSEVQTAFNALEEASWRRVFSELEPADYAEALQLISIALGAAKDALARRYLSLATGTHVPALDLAALFGGTERA